MKVIRKPSELSSLISSLKDEGKSIGFVPTMGALHEGHLSLIRRAKKENDVTVCSIFVNPKQFNEAKDFQNYPKTPDNDLVLLQKEGADIVFMPSTDDIYFEGQHVYEIDLGHLDQVMEGKLRPGHFKGVVNIVGILFQMVSPDKAYFGKKDYQQLMVIKLLANQLFKKITIVAQDTSRDSSGLALSSRNSLLSAQGRIKASSIYKALTEARQQWNEGADKTKIAEKVNELLQVHHIQLEYFEIAEEDTLRSLDQMAEGTRAIAFIAVRHEGIRLIDNMQLN
ncbi:MAG: pantoate--beta-alanine ligase [Flavobacteriales bacterium]